MEIMTAFCSDVGTTKETNQDSICIKVADSSVGKVLMAVVCDGMGGLAKGEVASANVINTFSKWFENVLPEMLGSLDFQEIRYSWDRMIREQNQRIGEYGRKINVQLGTTLTALLMMNGKYLIAHVGDTRAYLLNDSVSILTKDQTVVAREVERGNLTEEQAKVDPRRNVLLQCIGASSVVEVAFVEGVVQAPCVYMMCSDGFRHVISNEEIANTFEVNSLTDENIMESKCRELVELNKERGETDNITVLIIKIQ